MSTESLTCNGRHFSVALWPDRLTTRWMATVEFESDWEEEGYRVMGFNAPLESQLLETLRTFDPSRLIEGIHPSADGTVPPGMQVRIDQLRLVWSKLVDRLEGNA